MTRRLWKSMRPGLQSDHGTTQCQIGKWQKCEGDVVLCGNGFHASKRLIDAMQYVNMEVVAQVEVRGKHRKDDNKQVWSEMRIVKAWQWTKVDSVALSIYAD